MLIEFSIANYRSFRRRVTLSMVASPDKELSEGVCWNAQGSGYNLLRVAGVFGPNASGKSNLLRAMGLFTELVRKSAKESQAGERLPAQPFRFDPALSNAPSEFEIKFLHEGEVYTYGFHFTATAFTREYLQAGRRLLVERDGSELRQGASLKEKRLLSAMGLRENALWLSQAAMLGHGLAKELVLVILLKLQVLDELDDHYLTSELLASKLCSEEHLLGFLQAADLNITRFTKEDVPGRASKQFLSLPEPFKEFYDKAFPGDHVEPVVRLEHRAVVDGVQSTRTFDFDEESDGTQRLFNIGGAVLHALRNGNCVLADELDLRLHPLLLEYVLRRFMEASPDNEAQLLFSSHSPLALGEKHLGRSLLESPAPLLRRDQIYFVDKGEDAATDLYSLWDYKKVRKGEDRPRRYLKGLYRAIPQVNLGAPAIPASQDGEP